MRQIKYCIETDKNSLYVDEDVFDYVVSLEQQIRKQKEVIDEAIKYIKEKQKIQYKFALFHIECDDLLEILEDKERELE